MIILGLNELYKPYKLDKLCSAGGIGSIEVFINL